MEYQWACSESLNTYLVGSQIFSEGFRHTSELTQSLLKYLIYPPYNQHLWNPVRIGFSENLSATLLTTYESLTMTLIICYTMSIMEKDMINVLKKNGLLDWDFVSTLLSLTVLITLGQVL